MINVIAVFDLHPGKRQSLLDEFKKIVDLVHAEEGCIEYEPTVDVDTGVEAVGPPQADRVTVVEKWSSVETFRAHLDAPHSAQFRENAGGWIDRLQLFVTESP